jgi:signal transduction histidine kinase/DNA-binding response OmpR family regulator
MQKMSPNDIRILVVDDDPDIAYGTCRLLEQSGYGVTMARTGAETIQALRASPPHLVLLDRRLPDMDGLEVCRHIKSAPATANVFVIMVSGIHVQKEEQMAGLETGADGYIVRPIANRELLVRVEAYARIARLSHKLAAEIDERHHLEAELEQRVRLRTAELETANQKLCQEMAERKQAEDALARSQAELKAIYEHAPVMMCVVDGDRRVLYANPAFTVFTGAPEIDLQGGHACGVFGCINALDDPRGCGFGTACPNCALRLAMEDTFKTGAGHQNVEHRTTLVRDGRQREVTLLGATTLIEAANQKHLLLCLHDITERKQAEAEKEKLQAQLFQAQKIEGIGQLAGGVAHDFNNILASILMNLGLLHDNPHLDAESLGLLKDLETETNRAATLTRQLLAFSRRAILQVKVLDLNELLADILKMLRRLIGENITMETSGAGTELWIEADAGMIEQVVMNLVVNARDAMPKGGRLSLLTNRTVINESRTHENPEARPGQFVCLTVTDTGGGMDATIMKRIFEPFFTTKETGKGTGLGLATVYGIVKQHNGWVEVTSVVVQGTTFRVFLPATLKAKESITPDDADKTLPPGSETILLVEDEPSVRKATAQVLRRHGYTILEACNGVEALQQWEQHQTHIKLLCTDMIMPEGVTGLELAERLRILKPGLPTIISSGYSTELAQQERPCSEGIVYLPKPCPPAELLKIMRKCLDHKPCSKAN